ncbi:MAG: aldehyde oxidase, partial [Candidatus Marinimicrobia bacterium]|nr:aldehyde oxidase [Candidatus Neomarinimicrobiota bacterium]
MGYVGKSVSRVDAPDKIRGKAKYIDDLTFPDMLVGITVRSTRQRARIVDIKIPELPENIVTFSADEIPGDNYVALFKEDQPFLANGIVQYIGEPVLLLAGPDKNILREVEERIKIEYEDIPAINTIEEALSGKFPPIYGEKNIYKKYGYVKGDPNSIFKEKGESKKYKIFCGTYKTGY